MAKLKGGALVFFHKDNVPKLSVLALNYFIQEKDQQLPVIGTVCRVKTKSNSKIYYEAVVLDVKAGMETKEAKAELESLIGDTIIYQRYMEEGKRYAAKIGQATQENTPTETDVGIEAGEKEQVQVNPAVASECWSNEENGLAEEREAAAEAKRLKKAVKRKLSDIKSELIAEAKEEAQKEADEAIKKMKLEHDEKHDAMFGMILGLEQSQKEIEGKFKKMEDKLAKLQSGDSAQSSAETSFVYDEEKDVVVLAKSLLVQLRFKTTWSFAVLDACRLLFTNDELKNSCVKMPGKSELNRPILSPKKVNLIHEMVKMYSEYKKMTVPVASHINHKISECASQERGKERKAAEKEVVKAAKAAAKAAKEAEALK